MLIIGLTGGIGTGKSEVSRILGELGALVVNADRLGHEAYLPGTDTWEKVVQTFGQEILQPNQEIDRTKLGPIVFADPEALNRLNAIVHPKIYSMAEEIIAKARSENMVKAVVLEAAILIEANWQPLVEEVWVITASEQSIIDRIGAQRGLTEQQVRSRIGSQFSQSERVKHAHVIIDNEGGVDNLTDQIKELWQNRIEGKNN